MAFLAFISVLFPHLAAVRVDRIVREGSGVRIYARGCAPSASCSGCGTASGRVHSGYERKILDQTVAGSPVVLFLTVRRFFCDLAECGKTTFAEQIPGLTFRYGRSTLALRRAWEAIALALGGRAGARSAQVRSWKLHHRTGHTEADLARMINPIVQGWMSYYGAFYRSALYGLLARINAYLLRWSRNKYRALKGRKQAQEAWSQAVKLRPRFFAHWVWMNTLPSVW